MLTFTVNTLNKYLDEINAEGICFCVTENNQLSLCIGWYVREYNEVYWRVFAEWTDLNSFFNSKKEYIFYTSQQLNLSLYSVYQNINLMTEYYRQHGRTEDRGPTYWYIEKINDIALNFLKCLADSNSLEELELKLAIYMGQ